MCWPAVCATGLMSQMLAERRSPAPCPAPGPSREPGLLSDPELAPDPDWDRELVLPKCFSSQLSVWFRGRLKIFASR